ncbi:MAG TPA: carbamoyltransferase C-terminal domain-containing protein, partial [Candidatus Binatia bacterium]|nr:carbamoyltransferase C-terminal domain-containing protein [Candidatus Binatia bacterium]
MEILGIADHVNCGSALVADGTVLAAINDERLVREKMVFGVPRESIKAIFRLLALDPKDIDAVAVATVNQHLVDGYRDFREGWFGLERGRFKQALFDLASGVSRYYRHAPFLSRAYYLAREPAFARRRRALREILRDEFGLTCPVYFLDHHFCHAASAYYTSRFAEATVVTVDGGGDGRSCRVFDVVDGRFRQLGSVSSFDSLGNLYAYVTEFCGFRAGRHEGKITGLAAYGEPAYLGQLRRLLAYGEGRTRNVGNVFFRSALRELERLLPPDFSHKDLAASIQSYTEEVVQHLVTHWLDRTGHRRVALAGGLFSNVRVNQKVHELPGVESLYVHPGMSDEGLAVGAALATYHRLAGAPYRPDPGTMAHVYLGPDFSDAEIRAALEASGVEAVRHDDVEPVIARLLADGAVVARFTGRMEYGPRALGNRSILYQPCDTTVNDWLNEGLRRTEFMPFAPIVLAEHARQCFRGVEGAEDTARFMTITFDCTAWMARHCPGVVHVDNTARPQLVSARDNASAYRILAEYYRLTSLPCLINTSFNMHEEPIVCTPSDALRAFQAGGLDYLAIGQWIARHPWPIARRASSERLAAQLARRGVVGGARRRRRAA